MFFSPTALPTSPLTHIYQLFSLISPLKTETKQNRKM